jgi:formylglycine-generating enzyme required for sulfatase activity
MRVASAVALAILVMFLRIEDGHAEKRVALVVGNGAYQNSPRLPNPRNDAEDVAASLQRSGFETIVGLDMSRLAMEDAAIRFARAARSADVAMFYYSGHAIQVAGVNYLAPVDLKLTDENDVRRMIRLDDVVADLQQAKNLRILVLDACRDNPLAEELKRSVGATRAMSVQRGLAKIDMPQGMIVAYATQAGRTAEDGYGRNSPYTASFLRHIEAQEEIGTIFRRISGDVYQATRQTQLPELSLSLIGEFYLRGKPQALAAPPTATAAAAKPEPCVAAAEHWKSTEAIGTSAAFEDHINRFANCAFVGLAKVRLDGLKSRSAAVMPPIAPPPVAAAPCGTAPVNMFPSSRRPQPLSAAEECAVRPKDAFRECETCPEMVVVPAGSFMMGSPESEKDRDDDEGPQHKVTIGKPFAVGRFAVTFDEWDACVADGGCGGHRPNDYDWGRGRRPVVNVTRENAKIYLAWLSRKTGKVYRLPSEAEREYVTRAGTKTPFWWGSSITLRQANYGGNPIFSGGRKLEPQEKTVPVDRFEANPWGLFQVHGNIWEWTEDCFHESYDGAPSDGSAWANRNCKKYVLRGGSWFYVGKLLRAAVRQGLPPEVADQMTGFRAVRTLNR